MLGKHIAEHEIIGIDGLETPIKELIEKEGKKAVSVFASTAAGYNKTDSDSRYVKKAGDTMTGGLLLNSTGALSVTTPTADTIDVVKSSSAGNTILTAIRLHRATTGTPGIGGGVAFSMRMQNSVGGDASAGYFSGALKNVTDGSEIGEMGLYPDWQDSVSIAATRGMTVRATSATSVDAILPSDTSRMVFGTNEDTIISRPGVNLLQASGGLKVSGLDASANHFNTPYLDLDGNNDYVTLGDITELNSVSAFSFSFWFKQDVLDQADTIFNKIIDSTNGIRINTTTTGNLNFQINSGGAKYGYFDYSTVITAGKMHHIVVVYDGAGTGNAGRLKVYVDNTPVTLSFSGTIQSTTANFAGYNAFIGGASSSLDGTIKDFRVYSAALTAGNIDDIYNGVTDYTTGMVHRYKLTEGLGTVATDTGSNVLNGTITGATWLYSENIALGTDLATSKIQLAPSSDSRQGFGFGRIKLYQSSETTLNLSNSIGVNLLTVPTARLQIGAGSATAGTAPLKLTTGALLTTPEAGAIEYLTDRFYIRNDSLSIGASSVVQSAVLEVNGPSNNTGGLFRLATNTGTNDVSFKMGGVAGATTSGYLWIQGIHPGVANDGNVCINPFGGNVGIGTISPSAKLHITGSSDAVQLKVIANATQTSNIMDVFASDGTTAKFHLKADGSLGLGTATPLHKLDIVGFSNTQFRLSSTTANATNKYSYMNGRNYNNASADYLFFLGASEVSDAYVIFGGGSGSAYAVKNIGFNVAPDLTTLIGTRMMTINSTGVGIGTTTPTAKLHSLATTEQLRLGYDASNYLSVTVGSGGDTTITSTGGDISFDNENIGTTGAVKGVHKAADGTNAVADGTYTVGIGTTTNGTITIKDGIITAIQQAS